MRIVDAQIHLWGSGLPSNMAHRQVTSFTTGEAVGLMERIVNIGTFRRRSPPSWPRPYNVICQAQTLAAPEADATAPCPGSLAGLLEHGDRVHDPRLGMGTVGDLHLQSLSHCDPQRVQDGLVLVQLARVQKTLPGSHDHSPRLKEDPRVGADVLDKKRGRDCGSRVDVKFKTSHADVDSRVLLLGLRTSCHYA
jgi:hypothetical protein